jgi:hypothetical protein
MRVAPLHCRPRLHEENLDAAKLLQAFQELGEQFTLKPVYDHRTLDWLLRQLLAKRRHGSLQARLVRDDAGKIAGWFLYYLDPGLSRVLQLVARKDSTRDVLEHLFRHAADHGTSALEGRIEPRFTYDMGNMQCFFQSSAELTLLHSRDPGIMASLMHGDAFFTRTEGEWWLRFQGEPHAGETAQRSQAEPDPRVLKTTSPFCLLPPALCLLATDL